MTDVDHAKIEREIREAQAEEERARLANVAAQNNLFKLWLAGTSRQDDRMQNAFDAFYRTKAELDEALAKLAQAWRQADV
jgi:succinate dehydrogenase/fumarate reductase flavoprotein subunit